MSETADRYLWLTPDAIYVSADHAALAEVQSAVARLIRINPGLPVRTCSLQQLRDYQKTLQQHADMTAAGNNSQEQNRVLGYYRDALAQHASDIHFRIGE
ncbi:type II secretion protein E, partial [Salmonella enterica subsp. enterica serovar Java]|nr:type II secretion protein E [Salmonella enterica subsp. enterica serovar Java]